MQPLLQRIDNAFQEISEEDNRELCRLLAQGDNLQPGAEDAIATIARSVGLTKEQIAERVLLVVEIVSLLPVVAGGPEQRAAARSLNERFNVARKRAKEQIAAIDAALKKLYVEKMGSDAQGLQRIRAQSRLNWLRQTYPDLVDAVQHNTGISIQPDPPPAPPSSSTGPVLPPTEQPRGSRPAPFQFAKLPSDTADGEDHAIDVLENEGAPLIDARSDIIIEPDSIPRRQPAASSNIGANFTDLREQTRAQRRQQMDRRTRGQ